MYLKEQCLRIKSHIMVMGVMLHRWCCCCFSHVIVFLTSCQRSILCLMITWSPHHWVPALSLWVSPKCHYVRVFFLFIKSGCLKIMASFYFACGKCCKCVSPYWSSAWGTLWNDNYCQVGHKNIFFYLRTFSPYMTPARWINSSMPTRFPTPLTNTLSF